MNDLIRIISQLTDITFRALTVLTFINVKITKVKIINVKITNAKIISLIKPLQILKIALIILGAQLSGACTSSIDTGDQEPDPVIIDKPIAYVKRSIPLDENGQLVQENLRDPFAFNPGAELILRDRASPQSPTTNITAGIFTEGERYDVKDIESSFDGMKILFSMRAPDIENADEDEQPKWNIWEYDRETATLRRIILSDIVAEAGHDIGPHYLPDGRIVFSSTRQRQSRAILLDEGKPQYPGLDEDQSEPAAVLHVMNADGSDIHQISFNQSHDLDPSVLDNGKIIFTRWNHAGANNGMHLYTINPDGTQLSALYGSNSHATGTNNANTHFLQPRELPDLRVLTLQKMFQSTQYGGDILILDSLAYSDHNYDLNNGIVEAHSGQESASVGEVTTDGSISLAGRFNSAYPLRDGSSRLLVSWSQCRISVTEAGSSEPRILPCTEENLATPLATEAPPLYGLFIYDMEMQTQLPVFLPEENIIFSEGVSLEERALPNVILDNSQPDFNKELADEGVGVIHVRSVYDFDGTDITEVGIGVLANPSITVAQDRPARFLRVTKAVSLPEDDLINIPGTAFGRSRANLMKEILGYGVVEPDGSVKMKVPANVAFGVSFLDQYGRRTSPRHQTWIQLRPGETLTCHGCHDDNSTVPHGRLDAQPTSINLGATADEMPFPSTNPALLSLAGETMAETATRNNNILPPNLNLEYTDIWTDSTLRSLDPDINYSYSALQSVAPVSTHCLTQWSSTCRITINYLDAINPIWSIDRQVLDVDGITLLRDDTCTSCHSPTNADSTTKVPEAQLDLTSTTSPDEADHVVSYRELLFPDNEQEIVNGALIDRLVQQVDNNGNPVFETDGNGNLIRDAEGNLIPVMVTIPIQPSMFPSGAIASSKFVELFLPGGSHEGRLSLDELKLINEWLDIGAQYYNNPFDIPQ